MPADRTLRVAFVQASLAMGGAERLVEQLVRGLPARGVSPVVVNLFEPGAIGERLAGDGFEVASGLARSRTDLAVPGRLARLLRERHVDAVHVIDSPLPLFWIGFLRRMGGAPPFVLGVHSTQWTDHAARSALALRVAIGAAARVIALTDAHRDLLVNAIGVPARYCVVIRSGVDLARFDPSLPRADARRRAGLPADGPLVVAVASLRPVKNHPLLLRAFARATSGHPGARLFVAGDGPERPALEALAAELGVSARAHYAGLREDVPLLYRAADVAVLGSVSEALPVSLIEAGACATPVVATRVGSVPDVVEDGVTGWVVDSGDEAAFASRLEDLLEDSARREAFGAAARRRVEACFDERVMLDAFVDLFHDVSGA